MARDRHRKAKSSKTAPKTHVEKLRELARKGVAADPTNPRSVARKYFELHNPKSVKYRGHQTRIPKELERPATKRQREELKAHGFRTTDKGVIVDGPRDRRRNPIKGARVEVLKGGVIKTSVGQRRDFIYGFTRKEKKEFAKDPGAFEKKKLRELEALLPSLKKVRKKQVRLQWGAYQATKDFAPSYFTAKYFASISPEEVRRVGKRRAKPRADKLTGFHVVIHVPKSKQTNRGRRATKRRKGK